MYNYDLYAGLVLFLPLFGFLIISIFGKKFNPNFIGVVATVIMSATLALATFLAYNYFFGFGRVDGVYHPVRLLQTVWLKFNDNLSIDFGLYIDQISSMMLIIVTVVSSLVHLYSIAYMKGEERESTYFAYLQLFTFSMLGLVMSVNIFQIYIFWELVGVSSFLLIGFYFTKQSAVAAAKKAFIVTRFADLGLLIGILMLGAGADTFDFGLLIERLSTQGSPWLAAFTQNSFIGFTALSWALFFVFIGGAGKSAMFPLHIWLPDAMEGPTPVSALIHAATMVVAGVYLVARLFPVYSIAAPDTLVVIAYIAAFTALFASIIACVHTDLKKVLAYSTISQIAFMLLALGVSGWGDGLDHGYTASLFHLFTHAFFKAALFLCAGVIIHTIHTGSLSEMGGLRKVLPITHIAFLMATLSISGVPFFSGFFSKEAILAAAWESHPELYLVALVTSGITAFYMFRLYFLVFRNKKNINKQSVRHHESLLMTIPLVLLSIGSVFAGYIPFGDFVSASGKAISLEPSLIFSIFPVTAALIGISMAGYLYSSENDRPQKLAKKLGCFYKWAVNKFYIDEIYMFFAKTVMDKWFGKTAAFIDSVFVQGGINRIAIDTVSASNAIKRMQSGRIQTYGFFFLGGVLLIAIILFINNL